MQFDKPSMDPLLKLDFLDRNSSCHKCLKQHTPTEAPFSVWNLKYKLREPKHIFFYIVPVQNSGAVNDKCENEDCKSLITVLQREIIRVVVRDDTFAH